MRQPIIDPAERVPVPEEIWRNRRSGNRAFVATVTPARGGEPAKVALIHTRTGGRTSFVRTCTLEHFVTAYSPTTPARPVVPAQ